ncbi:hypothetical protein [Roseovarius faecimaris]|nr:hypothetical protein [Roseovarius faecimaris]
MTIKPPQNPANQTGKPKPAPASKPNEARIISKQVFSDFASI